MNYCCLAQQEVKLSIENQSSAGAEYYFDIYLSRSSDITSGDIYLGNADFIIAFDLTKFNNPALLKIQPSPGTCNFQPLISTPINDLITRANYFDNSSTMIAGNLLVINLNGPTPVDQGGFDTRVAKIDDAMSTHRLGSFKITGLIDPSSDPDLKWKTKGSGLNTKVFSLLNIGPFTSNAVWLDAEPNTCPDVVDMSAEPLVTGHYQAGVQFSLGTNVHAGSLVTLTAGDNLIGLPNFVVPLGATIEMNIQACQ